MQTKTQATLDSRNFFVSLLSIIFLAFAANGADVSPEAPGEIYDAIDSGNLTAILLTIITNALNPILKIVRQKTWSWSFLRSVNFWTQLGTVILIGLSAFGILFPDGASAAIVEAIFGGNIGTIITALGINIINPLWHWFFDRKKPQEPTTPAVIGTNMGKIAS